MELNAVKVSKTSRFFVLDPTNGKYDDDNGDDEDMMMMMMMMILMI